MATKVHKMAKKKSLLDRTYLECSKDPLGFIYEDVKKDGIRYLILRGPGSVNAYLGIPEKHPLAGFNYDDIELSVHGGLTYGQLGKLPYWPEGWFWYGWDYAHAGDLGFYELHYHTERQTHEETRWTPEMVHEEVMETIPQFIRLKQIAEQMAPRCSDKEELKKMIIHEMEKLKKRNHTDEEYG